MKASNIQPAERLSLVSEYYFSRKLKEVAQMNAEGKDIIFKTEDGVEILK